MEVTYSTLATKRSIELVKENFNLESTKYDLGKEWRVLNCDLSIQVEISLMAGLKDISLRPMRYSSNPVECKKF